MDYRYLFEDLGLESWVIEDLGLESWIIYDLGLDSSIIGDFAHSRDARILGGSLDYRGSRVGMLVYR